MRLAAAILALALAPASAHAAGWSTPRAYDRPSCRPLNLCVSEPAPRVAVNASGAAVAAWIDTHYRVRAALATRAGHFGAATTLSAHGLRPGVAIAADGTATVVWQDAHGTLRYARGRTHLGASARLTPRGSKQGDDSPRVAGEPDGSAVVVYESGDNIRAVTIPATGTSGAPVTFGPGRFDHDSVRAAPDGTLTACCVTPVATDPNVPADTAPRVAVYRPGGGWRLVSAAAVGKDVIETVFGTASALVLGTLHVVHSGDAGNLGAPGLARAGADDVLGASQPAPVTQAGRALAPDVTVDGSGRSVLIYQEKTGSQPFSRTAPVYAAVTTAGGFGARQLLDSRRGNQPTVRPFGTGAIAAWEAPHAGWGVAIESDGRFRRVRAPSGPGPQLYLGADFNYAHDLAAAGSHAVLAWVAADGAIRLSER